MGLKNTILLLVLFPILLTAQDLRLDSDFFQKESKTYQKWLDNSGFGETIKVRELKVEEKHLTLFLEFHFEDLDSIVRSWELIKTEFEKNHPISFEQKLFYKFVHLMEIKQSAGRIGVFNTYDLLKEPLFFRGISFKDGKVHIDESNPRDEIRLVKFTPNNLIGSKNSMSEIEFKRQYTKEFVFDEICKFAQKHFTQKTCENRFPEFKVVDSDEVLRFRAFDLCRFVLTDSADPLLAKILNKLGYGVNWVKREKLDFLITYLELQDGFSLHIQIEGKYGSGLYSKVGRRGYISMDNEFDEYLEDYADQFKMLLKKEILK